MKRSLDDIVAYELAAKHLEWCNLKRRFGEVTDLEPPYVNGCDCWRPWRGNDSRTSNSSADE